MGSDDRSSGRRLGSVLPNQRFSLPLVAVLVAVLPGCGGSATTASVETTASTTATTSSTAPSIETLAPQPTTLTAAQVVEGLRDAGLPIGDVTVFDPSTDPNERLGRPGQYTSKAAFADTRIGTAVDGFEGGGDVEAFDDQEALTARAEYLAGFAGDQLIGGWYQYTVGNAILRVPFALTPDQAAQYDAALQSLFP
jgi:hypothetical protein